MKTLFLNPNSSERVTAALHTAISRAGGVEGHWETRLLSGGPNVISSAADNRIAEQAVAAQLPALADEFDRIVLMSSLDTGYAVARQMLGSRVFGFTRSALAWQRLQGRRLQAITFGQEMAPLYETIFCDGEAAGVVQAHEVCPSSPLTLALADDERSVRELATVCERVYAASRTPVFVIGAVVLELATRVREQGRPWIIDPVADLLALLSTQPHQRP
ncbi:MAG: aspartate/glutamate racemase family protein [Pseudomonadota bacterium]